MGAAWFATVAVYADGSDDPLLDAKMDVAMLRLRYTERNPKMQEAEARLDVLTKSYSETRTEYLAHVQERIDETEAEIAALRLRYTAMHPKVQEAQEKLDFLQQERQRIQVR